jgi:hypothetical protein
MSGMQIAHGRNKTDASPFLLPGADALTKRSEIAVGLHQA